MKPASLQFNAAVPAILLAVFLATVTLPMQAAECDSAGPDQYLCGIASAEDLVQIPGTQWLIASAFGGQSVLNLVDTRKKSWGYCSPQTLHARRWTASASATARDPCLQQAL